MEECMEWLYLMEVTHNGLCGFEWNEQWYYSMWFSGGGIFYSDADYK